METSSSVSPAHGRLAGDIAASMERLAKLFLLCDRAVASMLT